MTEGEVILVYADVPPSMNKTMYAKWYVVRDLKQKWQGILETLLLEQGVPRGLFRVDASATMRFPVKRRRDASNFASLLDKSLGDALVRGGWLSEDTPEHYEFGKVIFEEQAGPARTTIWLLYQTREEN